RIDLLRLAQEGIPAGRVGRMGVAVITATLRVDDIAPQSHKRPVLALEIERHRCDRKAAPDLTLLTLVVILLTVHRRCGEQCAHHGDGRQARKSPKEDTRFHLSSFPSGGRCLRRREEITVKARWSATSRRLCCRAMYFGE